MENQILMQIYKYSVELIKSSKEILKHKWFEPLIKEQLVLAGPP